VVARLKAAKVDIGALLDYASSFGAIVISRAYADWSQQINASYKDQLIERAIDLTQMFPLSATKNGADIRLAVGVVEDLFRLNDVTHVVFVAGDSDYVALAQRAKRLGRYVVGIGVAGATSKALPAACNEFIIYDDLPGISVPEIEEAVIAEPAAPRGSRRKAAAPVVEPVAAAEAEPASEPETTETPVKKTGARRASSAKPVVFSEAEPVAESEDVPTIGEADVRISPRAATKLLQRALELGHDKNDEEWLHTSAVKQQIKRMDPSFHEKSLGYGSFTDFVKSRSNFAELDKDSNGQRVRLRPEKPQPADA
jgi:uncharacterized LabA/DUF88 family protein